MTITAHVCAVLVYVSTQLLDDSDPAVDQVLYSLFAKTIGSAFDQAILRGAGSSTDPVTGLASLITTNANAVGAELTFDDIIDLIYDCYDNAQNAQKIDIIGNTKAVRKLLKIKDNDGQYIYKMPQDGGTGVKKVGTLWGEPFHIDGNVSNTLGAQNDATRMFAGAFSMSGYVGNRAQVIVKANPWGEGFERNQVAFLAEVRKGFQVDDEAHFAKLEGISAT
jgi:HK97 family phage major capsid protein